MDYEVDSADIDVVVAYAGEDNLVHLYMEAVSEGLDYRNVHICMDARGESSWCIWAVRGTEAGDVLEDKFTTFTNPESIDHLRDNDYMLSPIKVGRVAVHMDLP